MRIIIVGCGQVGVTIARYLSQEGNDIVIIDKHSDAFDKVVETLDVMVIKGNGLSARTLREASVHEADLIISVTGSDETNILCCLTARKLGVKYAIGRVRDPEYASDLNRFRHDLGLDLIINPEHQAALEISRLLRFPNADNIETFVRGSVEMVSFRLEDSSLLVGKSLIRAFPHDQVHVVVAVVERANEVIIPRGSFVLQAGDIIRIMGSPRDISGFFSYLGQERGKVASVMVVGGSLIARYLVEELQHEHIKFKIIDSDLDRCEELSEALPNCTIIHGDGTDEDLLDAEDIAAMGAVVCLTPSDEENVIIGLYAQSAGEAKAIIKVTHINSSLIRRLGFSSVVAPQTITAYQIIRYVRGLQNSAARSSIRTMYQIARGDGDYAEALEFLVHPGSRCIGVPLKELRIREGILVGSVVRRGNVITPSGSTAIADGDTVIIIIKNEAINELDEILVDQDSNLEDLVEYYRRFR